MPHACCDRRAKPAALRSYNVKFYMDSSMLMPFFAEIMAFAVSCSWEAPTSAGIPQSADEIKIASQELIDAWLEATQDRDASEMYALLERNISGTSRTAVL